MNRVMAHEGVVLEHNVTGEKREGAHQVESNTTARNSALAGEEEDDDDAILHGSNGKNKYGKGMRSFWLI